MNDGRSVRNTAVVLIPEALATGLQDRIRRRRDLPEFLGAGVVPQVDPDHAESEIKARLYDLLPDVSQTRETLVQLKRRLGELQVKLKPVFCDLHDHRTTSVCIGRTGPVHPRKTIVFLE
jgi:hypothetical protein